MCQSLPIRPTTNDTTLQPALNDTTPEFPDLDRVGVIDVGSNSVRLVIFDGAARSPAYFFNEKVLCGLGRGLGETGLLNPEGRARGLLALDRFAALLKSFDVKSLHTVATAAVRDAKDGNAFVSEVADRTGIILKVASGEEEARLSAQGILLGRPDADGLVCDIGGASMELAEVSNGKIGKCMTAPLGPLVLADAAGGVTGLERTISQHLSRMRETFVGSYARLYLVGGAARAIAKLDMVRRAYPLGVMHEYTLEDNALWDALAWVTGSSVEEKAALVGASDRHPLLPTVARVLSKMMEVFAPKQAVISSYGIREGLLFEEMPKALRARDPLLEVCASMERGAARVPGFGAKLADWVRPIMPQEAELQRLTTAAGLLHDVSWRSHPSSRAEECFDNASRGNLGGIDHPGRVLLATALLHRYRKSTSMDRYHALTTLLSSEQQRWAQVLGYSLRLGASLAGGDTDVLSATRLTLLPDRLELVLPEGYRRLGGEVVVRRLDALASALGVSGALSMG